jgi:aspartate oxidase
MALTRSNMHLLATGGAAKLWSYSTTEAIATVQAANYFLPMYADLVPGDVIFVRAVVGGTEAHAISTVLLSNSTTVTTYKSATLT